MLIVIVSDVIAKVDRTMDSNCGPQVIILTFLSFPFTFMTWTLVCQLPVYNVCCLLLLNSHLLPTPIECFSGSEYLKSPWAPTITIIYPAWLVLIPVPRGSVALRDKVEWHWFAWFRVPTFWRPMLDLGNVCHPPVRFGLRLKIEPILEHTDMLSDQL